MSFDMLIRATGIGQLESHVLSTRSKKNDTLWETENLFHKFLRNVGFYVTTRNPSIVQWICGLPVRTNKVS